MSTSSNIINDWEKQPIIISDIYNEFKKDILHNRFFLNKEYLRSESDIIKFNNDKWHLRPEYFSYSYYDNSNYWQIILLVNNIDTRFNFRKDNFRKVGIYAPRVSAIEKVLTSSL